MKKTRMKRLVLAKETLGNLDDIALGRVGGADSGGSDTGSALCGFSDPRLATCDGWCTTFTITL
jgi:hypothetical protein